jgi:hypothetical protein
VSGEFDYNPDATINASSATWDQFIAHVFGDDGNLSPTVDFVSYEFDYYDSCGDHWRDAPVQPERSVKRERRSATASSKQGSPVLAGLAWISSDA